jgi:UPF0755 protein
VKRGPLAALAGLVLLLAALLFVYRPGEAVRVEIPEGLTARQTAVLLGEKGVVASVPFFRLLLKVGRYDRRLKPGAYSLRVHEWSLVVVRKLAMGLNEDVKVVIPEGFRASQIAERLAADGIADAAEFEAYAAKEKLEGRLFPSTYFFPPGYGAERAAVRMKEAFDRELAPLYARADPKPELGLEDALTLASIVEREAVLPQERPIIAALYLNRLHRRMPLQADPTVQYALGFWKKGLTKADLKVRSPYNTYLRQGLPPGPICSPGVGSFEAVLKPVHTQALYMMADARGGHNFSETNEEHNEARRAYRHELRVLREQERRREKAAVPAR